MPPKGTTPRKSTSSSPQGRVQDVKAKAKQVVATAADDGKAKVKQVKQKSGNSVVTLYLLAYNVASAIAWGAVLIRLVQHMAQDTSVWTVKGALGLQSTVEKVAARASSGFTDFGELTKWVQTGAVLEVIHAALGLVRSSVPTTLAQVSSRIILVWWVCDKFPPVTTSPFYVSMVLAWAVTEVVRYSYYAVGLVNVRVALLEWIRYNAFYILYPVGAGSEAVLLYLSASHAGARYGQGAYYGTLASTVLWPIALSVMMSHMHAQRRKQMRKNLSKDQLKAEVADAEDAPARSTRSKKAL